MKKKIKRVREVTPPKLTARQYLAQTLTQTEIALRDCQFKNKALSDELALCKHELVTAEKHVDQLLEFRRHLTANPKLVVQLFRSFAKVLTDERKARLAKRKK